MGEKNKLHTIDISGIIRKVGVDKLLIMAACGVVLVMLPSGNKKSENKTVVKSSETDSGKIEMTTEEYGGKLEKQLEELLEQINGIGNVKVMVTFKTTSEKVVLTEVSYSKSEEIGGTNKENIKNDYSEESVVVYEQDSEGNSLPYVVRENVPQIEGIAVVAEGGNNAENILKITNVAEALFGVSSHKISVIGMR